MTYKDVREWIQKVDQMGELKVIEGADWNLEIGALTVLASNAIRVTPGRQAWSPASAKEGLIWHATWWWSMMISTSMTSMKSSGRVQPGGPCRGGRNHPARMERAARSHHSA